MITITLMGQLQTTDGERDLACVSCRLPSRFGK